jgi:hypothetical protein
MPYPVPTVGVPPTEIKIRHRLAAGNHPTRLIGELLLVTVIQCTYFVKLIFPQRASNGHLGDVS